MVALLGRNGAGKSTLLNMFPAYLKPATGTVRVFGLEPFAGEEQILPRMGFLNEEDRYPGSLRAIDLLDAYRESFPTWDQDLVDSLIAQFQLDVRGKRLKQLSKGQRRQVGLLCAVGHRPELLVLDEPAGGLDPVVRRDFLAVVIDLLADSGSTVLLSSHQFADVERLADRVCIMHHGQLLADTSLTDLSDNACQVDLPEKAIAALGDLPIVQQEKRLKLGKNIDGDNNNVRVTLRASPDAVHQQLSQHGIASNPIAIDLEDLFIAWTRNDDAFCELDRESQPAMTTDRPFWASVD